MGKYNLLKTLVALPLSLNFALAAEIVISSRYENVDTQQIVRNASAVHVDELASKDGSVSDPLIERTILMAQLGASVRSAVEQVTKVGYTETDRVQLSKIARELKAHVTTTENELSKRNLLSMKISEDLKLMEKLAVNIETRPVPVIEPYSYCNYHGQCQQQQQQQQQMQQQQIGVTAGGAQDIGGFRNTIEAGFIPGPELFSMEGFLSEFDLSLSSRNCDQILCVNPAYKLDLEKKKLFVQVGMGTNVTAETFKRKPLNISFVLDISGSMQDTDGTDKTRLEWSKLALIESLKKLNSSDVVSVVIFDDQEDVLFEPTFATDLEDEIEKIKALETRGGTNVESGLRKGFTLVGEHFKSGYENRVILLSDAGLNTGIISEAELVRLVSDASGERINLTAVGVGVNFNQGFIHGITLNKGANYVFVQSGKSLQNYINQFDFLTTPVAYNFKARIEVQGLRAKLANVYGMPRKPAAPVLDLVDIRTLFLTSSEGGGGGATLLEYDLE